MRGCRAGPPKAGTVSSDMRPEKSGGPETDDTMQLAAASSRLGKKLIELHDVSKTTGAARLFATSPIICCGMTASASWGTTARKSTLLRLFAGELSRTAARWTSAPL